MSQVRNFLNKVTLCVTRTCKCEHKLPCERWPERFCFLYFLAEFGLRDLATAFALNPGETQLSRRAAIHINTGLWLSCTSIQLRVPVVPNFSPQVAAQTLEPLPIRRRGNFVALKANAHSFSVRQSIASDCAWGRNCSRRAEH
jgi:hypothetical protein